MRAIVASKLKAGPEQIKVIGPIVDKLIDIGWSLEQIVFGQHEWKTPKSPSEASKREKGASFDFFPVDIAVFDDAKNVGDYRHLLFIIECKAPEISVGLQQLEIYLGLEPHAKLGIWSNSPEDSFEALFVYKDNAGLHFPKRKRISEIPSVGSKIDVNAVKLTFGDLVIPSNETLFKTFSELLDHVVGKDTNVTRREEQLDQLCNTILLKLESDKQGKVNSDKEVFYRPRSSESETGRIVKERFIDFAEIYPDIFINPKDREVRFSDHTIHLCAEILATLNLIEVGADTVSVAFQVLRSAALKQEEGQYFTPRNVIQAAIKAMGIEWSDIILDPACGTGGFLIQCLLEMKERFKDKPNEVSRWAQSHLFGIDKDPIGIKLTKAVMQILGDGSANCVRGDSVLKHTWPNDFPHLLSNHFKDGRFSVIFTNPPFGAPLKLSYKEVQKSNLSILQYVSNGKEIELGLTMFDRCYELLKDGGRLCIVLPETYFFSTSYAYVRDWASTRLKPVGVINVPMEAFQGFCRAKTNLYIFEKIEKKKTVELIAEKNLDTFYGKATVFMLNPKTCGIYKNGGVRYKIDSAGARTKQEDNELIEHVELMKAGKAVPGYYSIPLKTVYDAGLLVPRYYDRRWDNEFEKFIIENSFSSISLGELEENGSIEIRGGHGSPSNDLRSGIIPYVKVSDIRNLRVNVNPTNLIPIELARKFWGNGGKSGLKSWDLITPNRASANIGEFAILLPGEEDIVLTKEVFVIRVAERFNLFDNFYLLWAFCLKAVRNQWQRVTLMQTNREDVGDRYKEIKIPLPISREQADSLSISFKEYFTNVENAKRKFHNSLSNNKFSYLANVYRDIILNDRD
jgi:type I restriction enzyme M protein